MQRSAAATLALFALFSAAPAFAEASRTEISGKDVVFDRSKGNCLACHGFPTLADAEQTGNSGPPIIAMQARFPDKTALRAKIWDATASSPVSFMPPFGKHQVLSEEEIDKVVDFVHSL